MLILCLLATLAMDDTTKTIEFGETGVFQPLQRWEVTVSPNGHVYALNYNDAYINHYGPDGEKLANVGRRGKGPGEFTFCFGMWFSDGHLYMYDVLENRVNIYAEDGSFVKYVPAPQRGTTMVKIKGGWLYGDWSVWQNQEPSADLYLSDNEFKNARKIMHFADKGYSSGTWINTQDGITQGFFSPISTYPKLEVTADGTMAYLADGVNFKVYAINPDGTNQVIERKEKRAPFDMDWAKEKYREVKERNPNVDIETNFPEFFPAIHDIIPIDNTKIMANLYRGNPDDEEDHAIVVDHKGKSLKTTLTWDYAERMVGEAGGFVFITVWDNENEEAGVVRVPKALAAQFAVDNPIVFDGEINHSINISD